MSVDLFEEFSRMRTSSKLVNPRYTTFDFFFFKLDDFDGLSLDISKLSIN